MSRLKRKSTAAKLQALRKHVENELAAIAAGNLHLEYSIGRRFADQIAPVAEGRSYHQSVFINCPFDSKYKPLFQAAAFTVIRCGYIVRCAKEHDDSSEPRLEKIYTMIEQCRFGIHDLSRTTGYPRYNMPFELGLFVGAKRYGRGAQDRKACLVFGFDSHSYDRFISDFSGHDIKSHGDKPKRIVQQVRDWLSSAARKRRLPPGSELWQEYGVFQRWLRSKHTDNFTWSEFAELAFKWKRERKNAQSLHR